MKKKRVCSFSEFQETIRKIVFILKPVSFFLIIGTLAASASVYSQPTKLDAKAENSTVEEILKTIESSSDFIFIYDAELINSLKRKTIDVSSRTIEEVLTLLFDDTPVGYIVDDRQVFLFHKALASVVKPNENEGLPRIVLEEILQQRVTGIVTDSKGQPMVGVTVALKGTGTGMFTDVNGAFSIALTQESRTLIFSFVGMIPQEIEVAEGVSVLNIVMQEAMFGIDEIVVTALGIPKEAKSLSYHVQQLSGDEITKVTDVNFVNNLQGRIAGVTINSSSVGAGGSSRVVMRGTKSIAQDNNVLYVVDGIPMPSLSYGQPSGVFAGAGQSGDGISNINPDDIESISVLTGPSAAVLYGSVGANGVVLITTKKGQKDRLTVSLFNSTTFSTPFIMPEFQNTYGQSELGSYYSWGEKLTTPSSYKPINFFQTGINLTNNVSLSTGTERNQTYVSVGSVTSQGIIQNNNYDRYNLSFRNTSSLIDDKMTMDIGFMSSFVTEQNMVAQGQYNNPLVPVYLFSPGDDFSRVQIYQRYDASRNLRTQFWPYDAGFSMQNPYWITNRQKDINYKNRYMATANLRYEILDWMNITGRVRLDNSGERSEVRRDAGTSAPLFASEAGYFTLRNRANRNIYSDIILNINKYFVDQMFNLTANVGASFDDVNYQTDIYGGHLAGVANLFTFANVDASRALAQQDGYRTHKQSAFVTAQLGYKGMAYLDVSARNDWASTFAGSNTPSMFYPSIGFSGVITEMLPSIKNNILSFARLRLSYAGVGLEPPPGLTIPTYSIISGQPQTLTRMPNPDLKPELTKSYEAGLNLILFGNRVYFDGTLYKSSTFNQFFTPQLSVTSGYSSVTLNAGQVDNKGMELMLSYRDRMGDFSWNAFFTFTLNRNKIVELLPPTVINDEVVSLSELNMGGTDSYRIVLKEGGTMSDIYVNTLKVDEHGAIFVNPTTQAIMADINTFIYAGSSAPKYNLSAGTSLGWKWFTLDAVLTGRVGGIVVSNTQAILDRYGVSKASADARDNGGVLVNGRPVPAQSYYEVVGGGTSGIGSKYVYSATNWRLNELKLSYDLPVQNWGVWLQAASVSFVGRNLYAFYLKAPFDPEITANTGTYYQGIDYFMMPSLRSLGFSVKLQF